MISPEIAPRIGDGQNKARGRFKMNSGKEMQLKVPALSKNPIRVVIDLETATFASTRKTVALSEHDTIDVIGSWENGLIDKTGIYADLSVIEPRNDMEAAVLAEAVRIGALVDAKLPIQCSVGAEPGPDGKYELVKDGDSIIVNGHKFVGDDEFPLYILRGGEIFEGSIVTFGADSDTGRVAARKHALPPKEDPMSEDSKKEDIRSRQKRLQAGIDKKHHSIIASMLIEESTDQEIEKAVGVADLSERDTEIIQLKAKILEQETEIKALKKAPTGTQITAGKSAKTGVDFGEKTEEETEVPKTVTEAMKLEMKAGCDKRGFALRAHCIEKYKDLERA